MSDIQEFSRPYLCGFSPNSYGPIMLGYPKIMQTVLVTIIIIRGLTLSRGGGPELTVQGGGQKRLRYIFWPYLLNGSSDLYEI